MAVHAIAALKVAATDTAATIALSIRFSLPAWVGRLTFALNHDDSVKATVVLGLTLDLIADQEIAATTDREDVRGESV
jgi:hypothetical protein